MIDRSISLQGRTVELGRAMPQGDRAHIQPDVPDRVPREDENTGEGHEPDEDPCDIPQHQPAHRLPERRPPVGVPGAVRHGGGADGGGGDQAGLQPLVPAGRAGHVERAALCLAAPGRQRLLETMIGLGWSHDFFCPFSLQGIDRVYR